jgi:hypothetical protein
MLSYIHIKRQNNVKNLASIELFEGNVILFLYMPLHDFVFLCPLHCWRERRGKDNTGTLKENNYLKGIPLVSTGKA